jgi:hypothetical protein
MSDTHNPIVPQFVIDEFFNAKETNLSAEIYGAFYKGTEFEFDPKTSVTLNCSARYIAKKLGLPFRVLEKDEDGLGVKGQIILTPAGSKGDVAREMMRLWTEKTKNITTQEEPRVMITAGSPGAGKTTLLYQEADEIFGDNYICIDPDEEVLMQMKQYDETRVKALELAEDPVLRSMFKKSGKDHEYFASMVAYSAWRWASNGISNTMQNLAVTAGYNIALGTTSTGGAVRNMLDAYDAADYKIDYLVVDALSEVKMDASRIRQERGSGKFVPLHDVVGKADALKSNLPLFFGENISSTRVFWRDDAESAAEQKARFEKGAFVEGKEEKLNNWLSMYGYAFGENGVEAKQAPSRRRTRRLGRR